MAFRLMAGLVIIVLSITLSSITASSQDTYGPACGRATIDGRVDPGEWTAADSKTFSMINPANQAILTATMRVMNSKNYLYLGITIDDDEFSLYGENLCCGDGFRIDFDNDNSGSLYALNDNVLFINAAPPIFEDSYLYSGSSSQADTLAGGTSDGAGFSSRQGSLNHFELRHPLCSGDSFDFCLSPGDTVGFRLEYLDAQADGSFGGSYLYPPYSDINQLLNHIVIAPCTIDDFFLYLPLVNK